MTSITLRFNDNKRTPLLTTSFLYKYSEIFTFIDINEDNNEDMYIMCNSSVFLNDDNKYYFDIYDDLFFMFKLQPFKFIQLCNILDLMQYEQPYSLSKTARTIGSYNVDFSELFITYIMNNNITLNNISFMYSEIRSINNFINNVDIYIQLKLCDITFYMMYLHNYIINLSLSSSIDIYHCIIKFNRSDIYNYITTNTNLISINKIEFYKYVHIYTNNLTHTIKQEVYYINYTNDLGNKLLQDIKNNNYEKVEYYVENGANIDICDTKSNILMYTVYHGNLKIVKYLIDNGADVNVQDSNGYTAIRIAIQYQKFDIVKYLISKSVNIELKDYIINDTVLLYTLRNKMIKMAQYLIKNGATIDNESIIISTQYNNIDIIKFIVEYKILTDSIDSIINQLNYSLIYASKHSYFDIVQYLIRHNIIIKKLDSNYYGINGYTALFWLCFHGNFKYVKCLVKHGFDVNIQTNNCDTPLIIAALNGHFEIVKYLIENGADVNIKNNRGFTVSAMCNMQIKDYLHNLTL